MTRLLDPDFEYTNSHNTNIRETFRKAGWRPMTKKARLAKQQTSEAQRELQQWSKRRAVG